MALAEDDVSQVDLDAVLNALNDPKKLVQVCVALGRRNLLQPIFERLEVYNRTFRREMFPGMITALCDVADTLPDQDRTGSGVLSFDALTHAWRLIFFSLQNVFEPGQVFEHIEAGILASNGVRLPLQLASHEERRPSRDHQPLYLVTEEQSLELKSLALERLRRAAADGRLQEMPGLRSVLHRWFNWAGQDEPKAWLSDQVRGPEDALRVLRMFLNVMRSENMSRVRFTRYILLSELESFVNPASLDAQTKELNPDKLEQSNQRALRAFRHALVWREEGRPDDYGSNGMRDDNPLTEDS